MTMIIDFFPNLLEEMMMTEYAQRRKKFMGLIGPNNIAIFPAAKEIIRNGDALYQFRQSSDFYYLTGFNEPEAYLVLAPQRAEGEFILFNRIRDKERETWDGPRAGQDGAVNDFHANQSFAINQFEEMLPLLMMGREAVFFPFANNSMLERLLMRAIRFAQTKIRSGIQAPMALADSAKMLHEMRVVKSAAEIAKMQAAIDITATAHLGAMQVCKPGMYEYELEAVLMSKFLRQGSRYPAYTSIVGVGCQYVYLALYRQ